jgi:hypothetical protein
MTFDTHKSKWLNRLVRSLPRERFFLTTVSAICVVREHKWLKRLAHGLYLNRRFLIAVSAITPPLTFLALAVALGHHPGPHGIGSVHMLACAFAGIYATLLGSYVAVLGVGHMMDALFLRVVVPWPKGQETPPASAGEPRYWSSKEKRPPRA